MRIDVCGDTRAARGESICGCRVEILRDDAGVSAFFADGYGAGVRAGVGASVAARLFANMSARGGRPDEIVSLLMDSETSSEEDGTPLFSFALMRVETSGKLYLAEFGVPDSVFLQSARPMTPGLRSVSETGLRVREGDLRFSGSSRTITLAAFNGGLLSAGAEGPLGRAWGAEGAGAYLARLATPEGDASRMAALLVEAAASLDGGEPRDDLCALVLRLRREN